MKSTEELTPLFESFIEKKKFEPEGIEYTGVHDEQLKQSLSQLINEAANDFQEVANLAQPTESDYHSAMTKGLDRFTSIYIEIDTEDRERICAYFEELMDIVGLESSGGRLNNFMYGFNPEN